jgi:hypothetical protein
MTREPAAPARRQCCGGCSLVRLLQRALVAAVLVVAVVYCRGHGRLISRPASSWSSSRAVDAFFGSLSSSPPPAAEKMRPEEVEPAVTGGETATSTATCATVERMGEEAAGGRGSAEAAAASLRVRELIRRHFEIHGTLFKLCFFLSAELDRLLYRSRDSCDVSYTQVQERIEHRCPQDDHHE